MRVECGLPLLLVLVLVVLAVVGVGVFAWQPLDWWMTTECRHAPGECSWYGRLRPLRSTVRVRRWGRGERHGFERSYFLESGFVAGRTLYVKGQPTRMTAWRPDGQVFMQIDGGEEILE